METTFITVRKSYPSPNWKTYTNVPSRPQKKGREFTFHWRGGYLTREVLADLVDQIQAAGKTRDKKAIITLNWPQAVLRFHFVEQQAEGKVFIEEVNEGEKL